MNRHARIVMVIVAVSLVLVAPDTAVAYGGPGSVISGIGALIAALAAIGAAVFGFLWFPAKRLVKKVKRSRETQDGEKQSG